jgi:hypothetical protein
MKKLLIVTALALVLAGSALAASLPSANSGSISVYVPGTSAAQSQPRYGGIVGVNVAGTGSLKNPRASIACYQSGVLVYAEAGGTDHMFQLGGGYSQWVANGGGAANCVSNLYYFKVAGTNREWSGHGQQEYVSLATSNFDAAA